MLGLVSPMGFACNFQRCGGFKEYNKETFFSAVANTLNVQRDLAKRCVPNGGIFAIAAHLRAKLAATKIAAATNNGFHLVIAVCAEARREAIDVFLKDAKYQPPRSL